MPGVHIIAGPTTEDVAQAALGRVKFLPDYRSRKLVDAERLAVWETSYPDYPLRVVSEDDTIVVFEGRLYGSSIDTFCASIRDIVCDTEQPASRRLARIKSECFRVDGDYVAVVHQKRTGRCTLINDPLGRLPMHWIEQGHRFVLTREIQFLLRAVQIAEFDSLAVALQLLLGYVPSPRTIFENVRRLPCASIVTLEGDRRTLETYHRWDFAPQAVPVATEASLPELFAQSLRDRHDPARRNVLGLSGGLDSRAVAGGLCRLSIPFETRTQCCPPFTDARDIPVARQVADICQVPWQEVVTDERAEYAKLLLRMKMGMNSLIMTFLLPFLDGMRAEPTQYVTGDGGDKTLPSLLPRIRPRDSADVVREIIDLNEHVQRLSLADISTLTGVSAQKVRDELISVVDNYPEENFADRYVHFIVGERGMVWLNDGEDRNRAFLWPVSPFWGLPFFCRAMRYTTSEKADLRLYRRFLREVTPKELLDVKYANVGLPVSHPLFGLRLKLRSYIPTGVISRLKKMRVVARDSPSPAIHNRLMKWVSGLDLDGHGPIDLGAIPNLSTPRITTAHTIVTLTSAAEYLKTDSFSAVDGWLEPPG